MEWQAFYIALVGGSAAFTGLLFVALTHHPDQVFGDATAHRRAVTVQLALLWVLFISLFMLLPPRYGRIPGALVLALASGWLVFLIYGQVRRRHIVFLPHAIPSDLSAIVTGINGASIALNQPQELLYILQSLALMVTVAVAAHRGWSLVSTVRVA